MITKINDANFAQHVDHGKGVVVVDFGAVHCGPCVTLTKTLEAISAETKGQIAIYELDVDESPESADRFHVRSLPTVLVFRDGKEAVRFVGLRSKKVYLEAIHAQM